MSMIKRFSMSYSIDKASKMKKSKQKWKHDSNDKPALTVDLTTPLIEFGYDIDQIMTAFKLYKFTNIDDAILVMSKDAESGKYNHRFVQSEVNSWTKEKCRICHGVSNDHIDFNLEKEDNTELGKETRINLDFEVSINNTENNLLKDTTGIFKRKIDKSLMKINPSSFSPATINIPQETLDSWEDPDICRICFADKITAEKKLQFSCGHKFCNSCVTNYLKTNINNSVVLFIKCLYGGCARTFTSDEIKNFVDDETYRKYRRFKNFQEKISNPDKIYINCPIVNCEEIVEARHNEEQELITFLECLMGHKFCIKCRKEGWHRGKPCTNSDLVLLQQIQKQNTNSINYRQCPRCNIVIEKNEGCNHMTCAHCHYEFCWLCLKEYSDGHYALYNVMGCPGMEFDSENTRKLQKSKCMKFGWFLLSFLLAIFGIVLVLCFFAVFGCAYEFVKCYQEKETGKKEEEGEHNISVEIQSHQMEREDDENQTRIIEPKDKRKECLMIALMIFLGIISQPIYLIFYFLYCLMECYRRFNCWFYYAGY